ncbi:MAG: hypothetical protein K0R67_312 [Paenibacillus sp.]|jgi:Uma2 family endonuclease|nr:hypothetical protein [Paenibacillus sp.]
MTEIKKPASSTRNSSSRIKEQQESYGGNNNESYIEERYEIIEGIRYDMKPSPILGHQLLVTGLWNGLNQTCQMDGIVVVAPMDVHLDEENVVQPDVIFISNENSSIIVNQRIHGAPNLLVEILSKSSGTHDKIRKKELYAKFAVPEYWIVDPLHHLIDQFLLVNKEYHLHRTYGEADTLTTDTIPCISIDLARLFGAIARFQTLD